MAGYVQTDLPPKPHRGRMSAEEEEAYVSQLTDEQKELYDKRKEERQATNIGQRKRSSRGEGLEADISVSELQGILRDIFEGAGALFRSDAKWEEDEFNSISKGFLVIINRFPRAKVIVRLLTPISSAAQLVRKVRKLLDARKDRQQENSNSA